MPSLVSTRDLAALLGVSTRTITDLAAREIVIKAERGRYNLEASVTAYCNHLREVAAGRGGEQGVLDLTIERARLAKEQADAQELKNAVTRGELLPASDVEREWSDILARVRSGMLAVTSRIRGRISTIDATQAAIIDTEIREALEALADDADHAPQGAGEATAAA